MALQIKAIEEGMDLYEPGDLTFTFQMLRTELENHAVYFINLLAEGRAMEIFEGLAHKYPNGRNFKDAVMADRLYPFFMKYKNSPKIINGFRVIISQ